MIVTATAAVTARTQVFAATGIPWKVRRKPGFAQGGVGLARAGRAV